ncbi:hypothetical protein Btru_019225 [Bulinus truncatus]|nr:hypothetical protein Btru_019225 [Bulinus truncatus]
MRSDWVKLLAYEGVITGLLEGVSTSVFACEAAHSLPEPVLLTLPSATLALVIVVDVCRYIKGPPLQTKGQSVSSHLLFKCSQCVHIMCVGYMLIAGCTVAGLLCDWSTFGLTKESCTIIVVVLILLAAVWLPSVQRLIHKRSSTERPSSVIDLVYVFIKIIAVCVTLYLSIFFKLDEFRNFPWPCFTFGLSELSRYNIWLPVVTCCCGGAMSSLNVWASLKVGLSAPGVKIPLILCVPLSMTITAILWNDFDTGAFWELTAPDTFSCLAVVLSVMSWLVPFVLPAVSGFKPKLMYTRMRELSWDTFFLGPKLLLANYIERELDSDTGSTSGPSDQVKTVYICTTMYKESQVEMLRYLTSVHNVFQHSDANQVKLEAHVFFDNSVRSDRLSPRARHLLALTCQTFHVSHSQLVQLATPYGCQVHTGGLLKYPLFLHFKDEMKVKCKKRWSQVMYFHYVLRFRATSQHRQEGEGHCLRPGHSQTTCDYVKYCPQSSKSLISNTQMVEMEQNIGSFTHHNCSSGMFLGQTPCIVNFGSSKELTPISSPLAISTLLHASYQSGDKYVDREEIDYTDFTYRKSFSLSTDKDHSSSMESLSTEIVCNSDTDQIFVTQSSTLQSSYSSLDQVFLLTTDADTEFNSDSVQSVLDQCQSDPSIAAVCGRTVPVGAMKPIVWYQKFEYAKDFWLVKSSQNIIGSVTCCPGCFSIYRGVAMTTVLSEFCKPTNSAFDNLVMDHGCQFGLCEGRDS